MSAATGFIAAAAALSFTPIDVDGLFIDGFAGGGGASTGIEQAIGRSVDIAINHSQTAIAIHRANHPETEHHCQDIRAVWPQTVVKQRRVAGAWFSPDCKEFSKAKGGPVKDRSIRALCWEVVAWLRDAAPTCGYLENVEEFQYAAPLDGDNKPIAGQEGREFKRFVRAIRALGYRVDWKILRACDYGAPTIRKRLYMVMRNDGRPIVWPKPTHGAPGSPGVRSGKLLPYRTAAECIDWSISCPSIFTRTRELADATKRRIAHGVMRYVVNAAQPFIVPVTHTQSTPRVHPVSEPLRTVTTANGGEFTAVDALLAPHVTKFRTGSVGSAADLPMPTVTANGEPVRPAGATPLGIAGATLVKMGNGERDGQDPRALDPAKPLGTITAHGSQGAVATAALAPMIDRQFGRSSARPADEPIGATTAAGGGNSAAVTALLSSFYGSDKRGAGGEVEKPLRTARAGGTHHAVIAAHMEQANTGRVGHPATAPVSTITTAGSHQRLVETTLVEADALPPHLLDRAVLVAAFLVKFYGSNGDSEAAQIQEVTRPLDTVVTKARFAVVTVTIDAKTYIIVDIGLRMLKPRELARAQGFPENYVLNPIVRKMVRGKWVERPLTIAEQISAIGNSVCPPVARALVLANQPSSQTERLAA
jgi:DNA (cytosine-5)-methyltransferase 1